MKRSLTALFSLSILIPTVEAHQPETSWITDTQADWEKNSAEQSNLTFSKGMAEPTAKNATYLSKLHTSEKKQKPLSLTIAQSPLWQNWNAIENIGPSNLGDSPVFLSLGPDNYWIFGRYGGGRAPKTFKEKDATLDGFDIPLKTTRWPNQFNAKGGLMPHLGGFNAWQSTDMKNWVHHGPITTKRSAWMTNAEFADGKAYFYYDFPNDQDPHVYVDDNLFDGLPGEDKGLAYRDPSHGSDCAIIRDLDGKFHLILEDWSPIHANSNSFDSPLAIRATSSDGISNFKLAETYPVDHRTTPTGVIKTYKHPHWVKEDPAYFKSDIGEYEVHEPAQNAYGDWSAISIGGQYYLFGDYDPADGHGSDAMSVGWFTSSDITKEFTFCDIIGKGHPDPDITFAEGKFYLATQMDIDYVSPGPWVESIEARVGVDTDNDQKIDHWTDWQHLKESYDYIEGFAKQVAKKPAQLDLSDLPEGYGFQYELKLTDTTENKSKPILDSITLLLK